MGVGYQGLQLALLAKRRKADFTRTLTLGRQNHFLNEGCLRSMFDRYGMELSDGDIRSILADPYAEGLFRKLGAEVVDSLDASNYEGATLIADLNQPLRSRLVGKYTCVVDFGVLEHIFNFPMALKNATDLLAVGGTFLSATIANNFMGHGFYQFSPELFFNYLPANGFADVEVFLVPYRDFPYFFRVSDPRETQGRVELVNAEPVQMCVIARKEKHVRDMVAPIQSDYYHQFWKGRDISRTSELPDVDQATAGATAELKARVASLLAWPESLSPQLVFGFENRRHYRLVDPAAD